MCVCIFVSFLSSPQPVNDIVQHVERGYRMDSPDGCPPHIYNIMMSCWDASPELRPTFAKIEKDL